MDTHIRFDEARQELLLLDQKALPLTEKTVVCATVDSVIASIKDLTVRGAPAIGVAAAWGCVLAAKEAAALPQGEDWRVAVGVALVRIAEARPTAVNLMWAVARMKRVMQRENPASATELHRIWSAEAKAVHEEDIASNKRMGAFGADLLADGDTVLTHCNAGALATAGFGTALGVIRAAVAQGKKISVIADETRPVLQGSRLTAYELARDGIPVKVACDNAAALLMKKGLVDKIIVGADRIAANGDAANKIGTYGVALLAKAHGIPFYVAAPFSTIDTQTPTGDAIPIEERDDTEVAYVCGSTRIMPEGVSAYNFAFDVTPAELIAGIVTEKGVLTAPYETAIARAAKGDYLDACTDPSSASEVCMNKETIVSKAEEIVSCLRKTLEANEGSTLSAIASSAKQGFVSLKEAIAQNEKAQEAVNTIKKHLDDVESAVAKGDRDLTGKLLDKVEGMIKDYKAKNMKG